MKFFMIYDGPCFPCHFFHEHKIMRMTPMTIMRCFIDQALFTKARMFPFACYISIWRLHQKYYAEAESLARLQLPAKDTSILRQQHSSANVQPSQRNMLQQRRKFLPHYLLNEYPTIASMTSLYSSPCRFPLPRPILLLSGIRRLIVADY